MDLTDDASEGAGWYLSMSIDDKLLMQPMPTSIETAYEFAQDFLNAMQRSTHELPNFSPIQVVQSGSNTIHARLKQQLAFAEEQASKIKTLREKISKIQPGE